MTVKPGLKGGVVVVILLIIILVLITYLPLSAGLGALVVTSSSMEPTIKVGSLIFIKSPDRPEENDVVTYQLPSDPNSLVTHRIVKIKEVNGQTLYQTQGDAVNQPDTALVPQSRVLGQVIFVIPYLGLAVALTKSRPGIILLIITPAAIIIYEELKSIGREVSKMKKIKTMKKIIALTLIALGVVSFQIKTTQALFADSGQSTGSFSAALDWNLPSSAASILPAYQTSTSWTVNYTSQDPETGLDWVVLYYRKGTSGLFALYGTDDYSGETSVSGSFAFTAVEGDGSYQFYTLARDIYGNTEAIPASSDTSTILDTVAPVTTLAITSGVIIDESVDNGDFESGLSTGWSRTGQVTRLSSEGLDTDGDLVDDLIITAPSGSGYMVRLGESENFDGELLEGNSIWDNRLSQVIDRTDSYLSFYWRVLSFDWSEDPAAVVMVNDSEILRVTGTDIDSGGYPNDSGWQRAFLDLRNLTDDQLELRFFAGNTNPFLASQSWIYIDEITTGRPAINSSLSDIELTASDSNGIVSITYSLDNGGSWTTTPGSSVTIPGSDLVAGLNQLLYYATDSADNSEAIPGAPTEVIVDDDAPDPPEDLFATAISEHEIELEWVAPADLGYFTRAAFYQIRVSPTELTGLNFDSTGFPVPNPPAPAEPLELELFIVSGLSSNTDYWLGITACDPIGNCSDPTIATATTLFEHDADPGDVVINELTWMGMNGVAGDEWLELRNMTDQEIGLSDWQLTKKTSGGAEVTMLTFDFGTTIPANGYLLIAEYDEANSSLAVTPDIVVGAGDTNSSSFALANSNLQIKLDDLFGVVIDTADDGSGNPMAGLTSLNGNPVSYSMERNATPGDGSHASSWHTTLAETGAYFDPGLTSVKGTPGAANQSQPPLSPQPIADPALRGQPPLPPLPLAEEAATNFTLTTSTSLGINISTSLGINISTSLDINISTSLGINISTSPGTSPPTGEVSQSPAGLEE